MDQILFTTGELEILVDLLVKLSQLRIREASSNMQKLTKKGLMKVISFTSLRFLEFLACMQGLITLKEVDLLREEFCGLKRGKEESSLCPKENKFKRIKNLFHEKLQFSECYNFL